MKYQRGNKVLEFSYPLLSIPFLNELVVTHDGYTLYPVQMIFIISILIRSLYRT